MADRTDPTARRTLIVAASVAALLLVAIAIAAARGPEQQAKGDAEGASTSAESTQSAGASAGESEDASGAAAASGGGSATVKNGAAKPPKTLRSGAKDGAPSKPAVKGSSLATLTAPPAKTIGMIALPDDFKSARFAITFQPYGWGPSGPDGGRLVALITKCSPLDEGASKLDRDFSGHNATLWCPPTSAGIIKLGGVYTGTLEVRRQSDVGVLYVTDVKVSK